ncbi:MAG: tRNA lysidine(34) synthetase TilS [Acidobacteriota bacterium]|nr:tRNA lysidine(34) synthetase TilS [Acidobacteriota bacterium]
MPENQGQVVLNKITTAFEMHKFTRNLLTEWRRLALPFADKIFVAAISGGADSVSLALALHELRERKKLNLRFVLAHFNHDLRGSEGDADEQFIRNFAERFGFELVCGKIQNEESKIQNQTGNLEQNARLARYRFLFEAAANLRADAVLTAHTLNDQAETFLLNLIRGSGLAGLGGMKTIRNLESEDDELRITNYELREEAENSPPADQSKIRNQKSEIKLIRPLLKWAKREATENFCREREIEFRYDAMNDDLGFKRVRIRKVLLPLLKDFNPKIIETLAQTANMLQADFNALQTAANSITRKSATETIEINQSGEEALELKELKNLFPSIRRQILRQWLKEQRGGTRRLDLKHLEAVENLISSRKSGRIIELPNGETVTKNEGKLFFKKRKVEKSLAANYNQGLDSGERRPERY